MEHYFTNDPYLKSEIKILKFEKKGTPFTFFSDNGVFSKSKIDYGSRVLIDSYLKNKKEIENGLDVGCGYGFIGIVLSKLLNVNFDLIDVNKRAVHLAMRNIKENKVNSTAFISNIYENVQEHYDLIITNPPIRAGKKVVLDILINAKTYLNKSGELWFVVRKDQGVKSLMKELEPTYKMAIMEKNKGFYVVKAEIC